MSIQLAVLFVIAGAPVFALPVYSWELVGRGQATALNSQGKVVGFNGPSGFVYTNGSLSTLPSLAGTSTDPRGINANGQIVGRSYDSVNPDRAFSTDGITISDLGNLRPGGPAWASAINDNGWSTGYAQVAADGSYEAFLHDGTSMRSIGNLGLAGSIGFAINNNGWVTGFSYVAPQVSHAFLYDGTVMHDLGTLGGTAAQGTAINSNGMVAGVTAHADGSVRAMSYTAATGMVDLGTLGGAVSEAFGVNDSGWIVGASQVPVDGFSRAFLHDGATMWNINNLTFTAPLPTELYSAKGINNAGQIIANGRDGSAYLLTPFTSDVPEPGTWLLVAGGFTAAFLRRRSS